MSGTLLCTSFSYIFRSPTFSYFWRERPYLSYTSSIQEYDSRLSMPGFYVRFFLVFILCSSDDDVQQTFLWCLEGKNSISCKYINRRRTVWLYVVDWEERFQGWSFLASKNSSARICPRRSVFSGRSFNRKESSKKHPAGSWGKLKTKNIQMSLDSASSSTSVETNKNKK